MPAAENKKLLIEAFKLWESGDSKPFFDLISEHVVWTVIGSTQISGVYHSKQDLIQHAFNPLLKKLGGELKTRFIDLVVENDKAYLRFESSGIATNGTKYEQVYCWAMVLQDCQIIEIVAYLDTDLLKRVFE